MIRLFKLSKDNKDKHVHRFELSAIRGELLREKERKRENKRERKKERKRERKKRERQKERESNK